jgi:putative isomerase
MRKSRIFTTHLFILTFIISGFSQVSKNDINLIDYYAAPEKYDDRSAQSFSDQGAWFSFSLPKKKEHYGGFVGPFIMSEQNGVWLGTNACQLVIDDFSSKRTVDWNDFEMKATTFRSHLIQMFESPEFKVVQTLFYTSSRSAFLYTQVINKTEKTKKLKFKWRLNPELPGIKGRPQSYGMLYKSVNSNARIMMYGLDKFPYVNPRDPFPIQLTEVDIEPGEMHELHMGISVMFGGDDFKDEEKIQKKTMLAVLDSLENHQIKKFQVSQRLQSKLDPNFRDSSYVRVLNKSLVTLQSNWRASADLLKHDGLFPSYHYKWFHGFWAWDSWKHAVALAHIDTSLAKNQIRAMYDYIEEDGFIPDCIYRDTTIEKHNYRNTKPPLSGWAIWEVFKETGDTAFVREMYPKLLSQHEWWYVYRDHDKDGICEYGSQDSTLIAARWESGMDNAVRFDNSKILSQGDTIFSLNQESVDLNCYLKHEKLIISILADIMNDADNGKKYRLEAEKLEAKIRAQFYDPATGWFYDTSIDGKSFIKVMGCEGWIPLWTNIATKEQAEAVKNNMMQPEKFFGTVPFQTLSASHPAFKPKGGYWRGPVWLDQAYFGVRGLYQYGYELEARKATVRLIRNAEGVIEKGKPIRENYHPQTGEGLEAENFSWSAAHYILLLLNR